MFLFLAFTSIFATVLGQISGQCSDPTFDELAHITTDPAVDQYCSSNYPKQTSVVTTVPATETLTSRSSYTTTRFVTLFVTPTVTGPANTVTQDVTEVETKETTITDTESETEYKTVYTATEYESMTPSLKKRGTAKCRPVTFISATSATTPPLSQTTSSSTAFTTSTTPVSTTAAATSTAANALASLTTRDPSIISSFCNCIETGSTLTITSYSTFQTTVTLIYDFEVTSTITVTGPAVTVTPTAATVLNTKFRTEFVTKDMTVHVTEYVTKSGVLTLPGPSPK